MVSKTTTASKGGGCLSVYGLLYRTFAMSIFVPALWSRWPQSALQTPFALSNCSCCILHGLDTRGLRYDRVPPPSLCAVSCSRTAQPREENYVGINAVASLFLAVVLLFWMARVDRCRVQIVSRSGERCPPPGQDGRILRERYSRCRDRSHLEMQQNQ